MFVKKEADGYNAVVPSIKGCECWAPDEYTAVDEIIEILRYYLKLKPSISVSPERGSLEGSKRNYILLIAGKNY